MIQTPQPTALSFYWVANGKNYECICHPCKYIHKISEARMIIMKQKLMQSRRIMHILDTLGFMPRKWIELFQLIGKFTILNGCGCESWSVHHRHHLLFTLQRQTNATLLAHLHIKYFIRLWEYECICHQICVSVMHDISIIRTQNGIIVEIKIIKITRKKNKCIMQPEKTKPVKSLKSYIEPSTRLWWTAVLKPPYRKLHFDSLRTYMHVYHSLPALSLHCVCVCVFVSHCTKWRERKKHPEIKWAVSKWAGWVKKIMLVDYWL